MNKIALATIGIAIAGSIGALARFGLGALANKFVPIGYPVGTLLINVSGAFCLGLVSKSFGNTAGGDVWRLILGVGFLGAFTTFSSMMLETDSLVANATGDTNTAYLKAASYIAVSIFLGLLAVRAGVLLGISLKSPSP